MNKWCRFGGGAIVAVILAGIMGGATSSWAQDILGFHNGYLTFTNENPSLYYRVEFKPNLTGSEKWDGAFKGLRNIQSSDAEVTVPVGIFYRVVGRDTPWVAGTALESDILSGKTAYVDDTEVTGTMTDVGQQTVTPGTSAQIITQGYHNGTGSVAGDMDLVAENIKKDIAIFGVTGTFEGDSGGSVAVPKTGQTTSYRTGDDGDLTMGAAWPDPRFTDHDDGTVTDNMTGLMWTKNASLETAKTWDNAVDFCTNMNAEAGTYNYTDWRLPNVRELASLIDYGHADPPLPTGHPFTAVQLGGYWSSSTTANRSNYAWLVFMSNGNLSPFDKTYSRYVWFVRAGQ